MLSNIELSTPDNNWEPKELRALKKQLANVNCKCSLCEGSKQHSKCANETLDKQDQHDQEILFFSSNKPESKSCTKYIYHCYCNCSSLIPVNMVRGDIFIDKESETNPNNYSCDKGTGYSLSVSEKSTSVMKEQHLKYSNIMLSDFISESSSFSGEINDYEENHERKDQDKVIYIRKNNETDRHTCPLFNGHSLFIDNFLESIRPPFNLNDL